MRKWVLLCAFAGFLFAGAAQADTAALIINGYPVESREYVIEDGVTMVSENFMRDELHLSVTRNQNEVTFFNDEIGFTVRMSVGDTAYFLNDDEKAFPRAVAEKEGTVYLPLRAFAENFGEVHWNEAQRGIAVYYDYNKMVAVPEAKMLETPIVYEMIADAEIPEMPGRKPVTEDNGAVYYEERDDNAELKRVFSSEKVLIEPVHAGYRLGQEYRVAEDYVYWIEYPRYSEQQRWYMYIKSREADAEPVCADEGSYELLTQIPYGTYILNNVCYSNGRIAYLYCDEAKNLEIRFYDLADGKPRVLDSISIVEHPSASMQVALNDSEVIWKKLLFFSNGGNYGTMYRYDTTNQQVRPFYEGCNFTAPVLTDDYLLVRSIPKGQNFLLENGQFMSGQIWAYSLKEESWRCRIDTSMLSAEGDHVFNGPVVLDDSHITLNVESMIDYAMPVVNLDKGEISIVRNRDGEALMYSPFDRQENGVYALLLTGREQLYYAAIRQGATMKAVPMWLYTK